MNAFLSDGLTSIHSLPILTTGHDRLHSCRLLSADRFVPYLLPRTISLVCTVYQHPHRQHHKAGLTLSSETMAIRVSLSDMLGVSRACLLRSFEICFGLSRCYRSRSTPVYEVMCRVIQRYTRLYCWSSPSSNNFGMTLYTRAALALLCPLTHSDSRIKGCI